MKGNNSVGIGSGGHLPSELAGNRTGQNFDYADNT